MTKRLAGSDTFEYTYDAENRLVQAKKNAVVVATFVYNGDGKRVKPILGRASTAFVVNTPVDGQHGHERAADPGGDPLANKNAPALNTIAQQNDSKPSTNPADEASRSPGWSRALSSRSLKTSGGPAENLLMFLGKGLDVFEKKS